MKKKDLYCVACDGPRYVRANSFAEAETKVRDHLAKTHPGAPASRWFVGHIELIAEGDMCID